MRAWPRCGSIPPETHLKDTLMPIHAPAVRRAPAPALSVAVVSTLLFALAAVAPAQAQQRTFKIGGPDELWDTTMKMEMPGMPMAMPAQTSQVCLKKDRKAEDTIPKQDDCRVTDMKTVGNKVIYTMDCAGKDPMIIHGEITSTPTSYDGKMRMKGKRKGEDMEMTQTFSGRKVGACTDQTEQVVAKAKSDSDAAVAKSCADGLDKLYAPMFFGKDAYCGGQQKQFRDKVQQLSTDHARARGLPRGAEEVRHADAPGRVPGEQRQLPADRADRLRQGSRIEGLRVPRQRQLRRERRSGSVPSTARVATITSSTAA